jgi:hypothetical protein
MNTKKIIFLVIALIIFLVIFYFLNKDYGHIVILNDHEYLYGDKQIIVSSNNLNESFNGLKYTFSAWIRTDNIPLNAHWDNTELPKTIINHEGSPNIIFILPNTLRIEISYKDKDGVLEYYNFDFELYESQVWNNFIIVVNNRNVDIYKNKLLVASKLIDNIPWFSNKLLSIGEKDNNFNGYIGFIDYFNYNISREQIIELYNKNYKKLPKFLKNYKQNLDDDNNESNIINLINK